MRPHRRALPEALVEGTCRTGKMTYGSRETANRSRRAGRSLGRNLRAYFCPLCHGWHLTTQGIGER